MIGRYHLKIDKMERRIKESENSFLIKVETILKAEVKISLL